MAYLKNFEHDIFISYARVDDATASEEEPGWVASFHEQLYLSLSKRIGKLKVLDIWRDKRQIDGSKNFDKTISDAIQGSAIFVALTSEGYLESSYCKQELTAFHEKARKEPLGLQVEERMRICNVRINDIDISKWPKEFGRSTGFKMNDAKEDDPEDIGEPLDPESEKYRDCLRDVKDALFETLKLIAEKQSAEPEPGHTTPGPAVEGDGAPAEAEHIIFFADVADTLRKPQKRIISELAKRSIAAIKDIPPPFDPAAHDEKVIEAIKQSTLSVHLLDAYAGREMRENDATTFRQRQVELAREHAKSMLIWVDPELDIKNIEDENHRSFLQSLERDRPDKIPYQFIRGERLEITQSILDEIERLQEKQRKETAAGINTILDWHVKDNSIAFKIAASLQEKGIDLTTSQVGSDPDETAGFFEKMFQKNKSLIVLYGGVAREWVSNRLDMAIHTAVNANLNVKLAVYAAGQSAVPSNDFNRGFISIPVLNTPEAVFSFLNQAS